MSKYVVVIDLFVIANSPEHAIAQAQELAGEMRYVHDNSASVLQVVRPAKFVGDKPKVIYPTPTYPKKA
jgi:hypothetical protein